MPDNSSMMRSDPVVIVGMAVEAPGGIDTADELLGAVGARP